MQLLAKMCGWNEPEKHEFEHGYKAQQGRATPTTNFPTGPVATILDSLILCPLLGSKYLADQAVEPTAWPDWHLIGGDASCQCFACGR
jgi:hypothetical protein